MFTQHYYLETDHEVTRSNTICIYMLQFQRISYSYYWTIRLFHVFLWQSFDLCTYFTSLRWAQIKLNLTTKFLKRQLRNHCYITHEIIIYNFANIIKIKIPQHVIKRTISHPRTSKQTWKTPVWKMDTRNSLSGWKWCWYSLQRYQCVYAQSLRHFIS
jgi:hypothetical protein